MMFKKIKYWVYQLCILDCLGCGSLVVHSRGLCLKCEHHVFKGLKTATIKLSYLPESGIPFRFLFNWRPGESDILSRYVHLLKSPLAEPIWVTLSKDFQIQKVLPQNSVFVPIPSRKGRRHSRLFAAALAAMYGGQVVLALQISSADPREQKRKSKEERMKIRFELNEEFTERLQQASAVILVDDVITTGASYQAAYNVLKNRGVWPEHIELWTAFYRERMKLDFH